MQVNPLATLASTSLGGAALMAPQFDAAFLMGLAAIVTAVTHLIIAIRGGKAPPDIPPDKQES